MPRQKIYLRNYLIYFINKKEQVKIHSHFMYTKITIIKKNFLSDNNGKTDRI